MPAYSRFACRLNMPAEFWVARCIRRRIVRSRKIERLCSNKVPIGWMEDHPESALTFGVGAGMRMVTSASRPMDDSGNMVTNAILPLISRAFFAICTRLPVSPEPEPMSSKSVVST